MQQPSLENLVESCQLNLEVFHPGGLQITRELAVLCHIGAPGKVLEVACGTGESACYMAETFGAQVIGVDASASMIQRASAKAKEKNLPVKFERADAHALPFAEGSFDAVVSECTTCILDKGRAIGEMTRVTRAGGYVGIHDLCWKVDAPEHLKHRLAEIEGERPETLAGWAQLFERAGLTEVITVDKSDLIPSWVKGVKKELGFAAQARIFRTVLKTWGLRGLKTVLESERIFRSVHMGYGIIVGRKR